MFYLPNIPYAIYLALKCRSFVFFSITNPAIKHSGNGYESKFETLKLIPSKQKPISIFIKKNENLNLVLSQIEESKLNYPLIIKPDIGFRGLLVKQIKTEQELKKYLLKNNCIDLILQEFITYKNECGIFYYRLPNSTKGQITSITLKKFLSVVGDGNSSLKELIQNDKRAVNYIEILENLHKNKLQQIPLKNEEVLLTVIGNHSKGTQFLNGNHLISEELENSIDTFMKNIPGFFYGRLDLKYESFEYIYRHQDFKVLEINGIIAEPTHIYDASTGTYFKALKEIRKHWEIISKIVIQNKKNGVKYEGLSSFLKSVKDLKKYATFIKKHNLSS